MKPILFFKTVFLPATFLLACVIQGCVFPYTPTERAAFVIINELDVDIVATLNLDGKDTAPFTIKPHQYEYPLQYEQKPGSDAVPKWLKSAQIEVFDCSLRLDQATLVNLSELDPAGRAGRNLSVNESFLAKHQCSTIDKTTGSEPMNSINDNTL